MTGYFCRNLLKINELWKWLPGQDSGLRPRTCRSLRLLPKGALPLWRSSLRSSLSPRKRGENFSPHPFGSRPARGAKNKKAHLKNRWAIFGSPGRTRTCDLLVTVYPDISTRSGLSHHPVSRMSGAIRAYWLISSSLSLCTFSLTYISFSELRSGLP